MGSSVRINANRHSERRPPSSLLLPARTGGSQSLGKVGEEIEGPARTLVATDGFHPSALQSSASSAASAASSARSPPRPSIRYNPNATDFRKCLTRREKNSDSPRNRGPN